MAERRGNSFNHNKEVSMRNKLKMEASSAKQIKQEATKDTTDLSTLMHLTHSVRATETQAQS